MDEHINATLYRRAIAAFNATDMDTLKGLIADDVIWHEAGAPAPHEEREAVLSRFGDYSGDVEGDVRVVDILANDDRVVAIMDVKMTRDSRRWPTGSWRSPRSRTAWSSNDGRSWTPCPTTSRRSSPADAGGSVRTRAAGADPATSAWARSRAWTDRRPARASGGRRSSSARAA